MSSNTSISLLEFSWNSLTTQQKFRVKVKYELKKALENRTGTKVSVYKAIAEKHGYTIKRIQDIAFELKNNYG